MLKSDFNIDSFPRILVTISYPELRKTFEGLAAQMGLSIFVIDALAEYALEEIKAYPHLEDIDVIVSRGATAHIIQKNLNIPVVQYNTSAPDILQALVSCSNDGPIGLFVHNSSYNDKMIRSLLGINYHEFHYNSARELMDLIDSAVENGISSILVCNIMGIEYAARLGVKSILLHSSYKSVVDAFILAAKISTLRKNDLMKNKYLDMLLAMSDNATIVYDNNNDVVLSNKLAMNVIGNSYSIQKNDIEYIHKKAITNIISKDDNIITSVMHIHRKSYLAKQAAIRSYESDSINFLVLQEAAKVAESEEKLRVSQMDTNFHAQYTFDDIIGTSKTIKSSIEYAKIIARINGTVLIQGESGTGKEVFAQSIHNASDRANHPFIAVNCAALPQSLLESELFGYEEGSFTGAKRGGKKGLFELAHRGTIFLDEIGLLPLEAQASLLRVLQEKKVSRIGASRVIPIDVRIIAATNENLLEMVQKRQFRNDLYYRLAVFDIFIPPLREHPEDIPLLLNYFAQKAYRRDSMPPLQYSRESLEWALSYPWPGNVRELSIFVEKMSAFCQGVLTMEDLNTFHYLHKEHKVETSNHISVPYGTLKEVNDNIIKQYWELYEKKPSIVAKMLGISRSHLWKKLKELGVNVSSK